VRPAKKEDPLVRFKTEPGQQMQVDSWCSDARKKSNPDWARFAALTSNVPFVAIAQGRNRIVWREIGWLRLVIGIGAYLGTLLIHP
jgi:uncharacterized membrane protein